MMMGFESYFLDEWLSISFCLRILDTRLIFIGRGDVILILVLGIIFP